jgi:hypothetical protein
MIKSIISIILAILIGLIILKVIGFMFTIMWVTMKLGIILVIAVPFYFLIKNLLKKF